MLYGKINVLTMKKVYETPEIEVVDVKIEKGFSATGDDDPTTTNPTMPWG